MFCNLYKCFLKGAQAFQNQPFIDPLLNRCYWIIDKLHRKKSALESLFNEAAVRRTCSLIKGDSDTCASLRIFVIFKLCKLLQTLQTCKLSEFTNFQNNFLEENLWMLALTQVLRREFCEFFKNTYFVEDLRNAGSEALVRGLSLTKLEAWRIRNKSSPQRCSH